MGFPWKQVEKHIHEHRREMGWNSTPCVRLALKSGERYLVHRVLESTEELFAALVYLNEETIDETPRFHYMAFDPEVIGYMEAFEPEPRRPEQLKRFSFTVVTGGVKERTDRLERGQVSQ